MAGLKSGKEEILRRTTLLDHKGQPVVPPRWTCWTEDGELDPDIRRVLPADYPPRPPVFSMRHHIDILCYALTSRDRHVYLAHGNHPDSRLLELDGDRILSVFLFGRATEKFPEADRLELWAAVSAITTGHHLTILGKFLGLHVHGRYFDVVDRQQVQVDGMPPNERIENVFEAFVSAVYRCFGYQVLYKWLTQLFDVWLDQSMAFYRSSLKDRKYTNSVILSPPYVGFVDEFFRSREDHDNRSAAAVALLHARFTDHPIEFPPEYPPLPPSFVSSSDKQRHALIANGLSSRFNALGRSLVQAVAVELALTCTGTEHFNLDSPRELHSFEIYLVSDRLLSLLGEAYGVGRYTVESTARARVDCMRSLFGFVFMSFGWEKTREWMKALYLPWVEAAYAARMGGAKPRRKAPLTFYGERTFPFVRRLGSDELLQYSSALKAFTSCDMTKVAADAASIQQRGIVKIRESIINQAFQTATRHWSLSRGYEGVLREDRSLSSDQTESSSTDFRRSFDDGGTYDEPVTVTPSGLTSMTSIGTSMPETSSIVDRRFPHPTPPSFMPSRSPPPHFTPPTRRSRPWDPDHSRRPRTFRYPSSKPNAQSTPTETSTTPSTLSPSPSEASLPQSASDVPPSRSVDKVDRPSTAALQKWMTKFATRYKPR